MSAHPYLYDGVFDARVAQLREYLVVIVISSLPTCDFADELSLFLIKVNGVCSIPTMLGYVLRAFLSALRRTPPGPFSQSSVKNG